MDRIQALLQNLSNTRADAIFINSEPNITYLTGFSGDSSRLIVAHNAVVLITDGRYTEQAERECSKDIRIFKWLNDKRYSSETYEFLIKELNIQTIGFEGNKLTYSEFTELQNSIIHMNPIPLFGLVENLRIIKNDLEIEYLRTACEISDRALHDTLKEIKPGKTESEIAGILEFNLRKHGSESLSFDTLLLSGSRTSLLHGKPGVNKLQTGDFLLLDFGATYQGYHADMSRTFILGKADAKKKELYSIIYSAQKDSVQCICDGVEGKRADEVVRKNIPDKYIEYYYPGLGHGVGLEIHESPFIRNTSEFIFQKGMTVTIEPGIYLPGFGGLRIEDTIVVKNEGAEILTKFPRELMEL